MKTEIKSALIFLFLATVIISAGCKKDEVMTDAEKVAALKNVSVSYNNMTYQVGLPDGALLSGKTFSELLLEDSSKYADPANYSVALAANLTADNNKENAEDAKFDGMILDVMMDTILSSPFRMQAPAFDLPKNTAKTVSAGGSINLKTHRLMGLYIFKQVAGGQDLATILSPVLQYKIGVLNGEIEIPDMHKNIPTTASDELKAFLADLINSGIFAE